jgi:hypothetical protein
VANTRAGAGATTGAVVVVVVGVLGVVVAVVLVRTERLRG